MTNQTNTDTSNEMSLADRKVIYRARRGLKELDYYFDPYVRQHFLQADAQEKADFSLLIDQEDPDLLDWFMGVTLPPDELVSIINRIKSLKA
ncbi:MAG: succinate dehydrogenase assembly factor 2 [Gammaproteobacteria bacterium]|nr:succinate dehydrogenase assembly factor 2 [Gammaproteobacteria bacterium]